MRLLETSWLRSASATSELATLAIGGTVTLVSGTDSVRLLNGNSKLAKVVTGLSFISCCDVRHIASATRGVWSNMQESSQLALALCVAVLFANVVAATLDATDPKWSYFYLVRCDPRTIPFGILV